MESQGFEKLKFGEYPVSKLNTCPYPELDIDGTTPRHPEIHYEDEGIPVVVCPYCRCVGITTKFCSLCHKDFPEQALCNETGASSREKHGLSKLVQDSNFFIESVETDCYPDLVEKLPEIDLSADCGLNPKKRIKVTIQAEMALNKVVNGGKTLAEKATERCTFGKLWTYCANCNPVLGGEIHKAMKKKQKCDKSDLMRGFEMTKKKVEDAMKKFNMIPDDDSDLDSSDDEKPDKETTGERDKEAIGERDKETTGEKDKETTGERDKDTTGEGDKETTGEGGKETTGEGDKETTGEGNKETTGEGDKETTETKKLPCSKAILAADYLKLKNDKLCEHKLSPSITASKFLDVSRINNPNFQPVKYSIKDIINGMKNEKLTSVSSNKFFDSRNEGNEILNLSKTELSSTGTIEKPVNKSNTASKFLDVSKIENHSFQPVKVSIKEFINDGVKNEELTSVSSNEFFDDWIEENETLHLSKTELLSNTDTIEKPVNKSEKKQSNYDYFSSLPPKVQEIINLKRKQLSDQLFSQTFSCAVRDPAEDISLKGMSSSVSKSPHSRSKNIPIDEMPRLKDWVSSNFQTTPTYDIENISHDEGKSSVDSNSSTSSEDLSNDGEINKNSSSVLQHDVFSSSCDEKILSVQQNLGNGFEISIKNRKISEISHFCLFFLILFSLITYCIVLSIY